MSSNEPATSPRMGWIITGLAVLVAAAPHAFFAPPLQLHMEGQMQAWLGIAVWAPAILAGVGFFFGVEFSARSESGAEKFSPPTRTAAVVIGLILYLLVVSMLHVDRWTQMDTMRPWAELERALPLFAALGAMQAVFWQGFVQDRTLANATPPVRVAVLVGLALVVVAPFAVAGDTQAVLMGLLPVVAAEALLAAIAFEVGTPLRTVMLLRAVCGLAFIWFQQALLL